MWEPQSSRQKANNLNSSQVRIEDWISSDMDPSKSKGTPAPPQHTANNTPCPRVCLYMCVCMVLPLLWIICSSGTDSVDTAGSETMLQFNNSPVGSRTTPEFQHKRHGALQSNRGQSYSNFSQYRIFMSIIYMRLLNENRTTRVLHSFRLRGKWLSENLWSDQLHFKRR